MFSLGFSSEIGEVLRCSELFLGVRDMNETISDFESTEKRGFDMIRSRSRSFESLLGNARLARCAATAG